MSVLCIFWHVIYLGDGDGEIGHQGQIKLINISDLLKSWFK